MLGHSFISVKNKYYELLTDNGFQILKQYACKIRPLGRGLGGIYFGSISGYDGEIIKNSNYFIYNGKKLMKFDLNKTSLAKIVEKSNIISIHKLDSLKEHFTENELVGIFQN